MRSGYQTNAILNGAISAPTVLQWSASAFVVSLIFFLGFEDFDINVSAMFYANGVFVGRQPAVETIRTSLKLVYIAGLICAIAGIWYGYARHRNFLQLSKKRWMVVLATLVVGPGLVANVLLKDQMGRARPHQTEIFGGTRTFTPPLIMTNQCEKNCSFVSGEASSMFALFFGLAMVAGPRARPLFALGLAMGAFAGLIRIAQGAHFLSDVIFAGIFMALTAAIMRVLFIDLQTIHPAISPARAPEDSH